MKTLIAFILILFITTAAAQHPSGQTTYESVPVEAGLKGADPELESIRKKVIGDFLPESIDKSRIDQLLATSTSQFTWPDINYEDVSRTGFQHSWHLSNTLSLAQAYRKPKSPYYGRKDVGKVIYGALEFWTKNDFICDNWWWNEMGVPNAMISILLVMDEALPSELKKECLVIAGRANMKASGARPGGDLIQIAAMRAKQALYQRNSPEFEKISRIMASEIKTTTGRGMKPDLSFHHRIDNVISTLSYGTGYTSSFAYWARKNRGTKYALPDEALELLVDHFIDGISASIAFGKFPDPGAKNRELSRRNTLAPVNASLAVSLRESTDYRKTELDEIIKSIEGRKAVIAPASHFFWHSEYFTFQRPGFFSSVRMHSDRNHNMEYPHNDEGLLNHHFADGSNFLIRNGEEYLNIFPVWDWQKIPGTTIVQKPALPHWREIAKKGKNSFTGGVTDGVYGAAAFDFASPHDPLTARKSWFFFDNEYVCLGQGITSHSDYPVATTLDQRLLNGSVRVIFADNTTQSPAAGDHSFPNVRVVSHDNVGYIFFEPQDIHLSKKKAGGSWGLITKHSWASDAPEEKEVFSLWIDHKTQPSNASYAYLVVPRFDHLAIPGVQAKIPVQIISNTTSIQAVWNEELQICQAVFYDPGRITLPNGNTVSSESPCMLMVHTDENKILSIAVSDPGRGLASLKLNMTFSKPTQELPDFVTVTTVANGFTWEFELPEKEMAGKSVVVELK